MELTLVPSILLRTTTYGYLGTIQLKGGVICGETPPHSLSFKGNLSFFFFFLEFYTLETKRSLQWVYFNS